MSAEIQTGDVVNIDNQVIATGVTEEEYLEKYAPHFCEWVNGKVIRLSPVMEIHDVLNRYLAMLLEAYLSLRPIGVVRQAPYAMRLEHQREPDVQVILNDNPHERKPSYLDGPADICIEIVSEESVARDYGEKFAEYEKGGVREYWIVDPIRKDARFYRRSDDGVFIPLSSQDQTVRSHILKDFALHIPTFWQEPLPDILQIVDTVKAMVSEGA